MALNIFKKLQELGFKTCPEDFYTYVDKWKAWYDGNVKSFHDYVVYNGQKHIRLQRYSLGMGKKVCEDWANLLLNEKVKITLEGEQEQAFFDSVCKANSFEVKANELEELTFQSGTTAIIVRAADVLVNQETQEVSGTGRLVLDYCYMPNIFPLSWENGRVIECAFATRKVNGDDVYMYVQIHRLDENKEYVIENLVFKDTNGTLQEANLSDVPELANVSPTVTTHQKERLFVINRPNIVNNVDPSLPLGISVFANAIPQLKGCDISYDAYVNEMVTGKKRLIVKAEALQNIDGEPTFDPDDVVFYALPEDSSAETMITPIDPALRCAELNQGVQDMLNTLSSKCGFGQHMYKFDQGSVATARQIVSENSDLYRGVKKHEIILRGMLEELARIILRMGNTYCGQHLNEQIECTIDFDDSIIQDKETERANDRADLAAGIMNRYEYRMKWYNESEETAKAALPPTNELMHGLVEDDTENNPPPGGDNA